MTLNIISNFAANTALRNLTLNGDAVTKSVAKLSSGTRVTSAADDAASLAIGSRINLQVQSLGQASVNAGQATSLLQVADGALSGIQSLLTRAKVLSVQAGSQNLSNTERALVDSEFQNILGEIDRISAATTFDGQTLIQKGSSPAVANQAANFGDLGTTGVINLSARGFRNRATTDTGDGAFTVQISAGSAQITSATGSSNQIVFTAIAQSTVGSLSFNATISTDLITNAGNSSTGDLVTGTTLNFTRQTLTGTSGTALTSYTQTRSELVLNLDETFNVASLFATGGNLRGSFNITQNNNGPTSDFTFKVGTGVVPTTDNIALSIGGVTVENLGLANAAVTSFSKADSASQSIDQALNYLVQIRADVGGSTNRLSAASANIATTSTNLEAARSQLLDLDVAAEITNFTSKQILVQAGISVLAQANQLPQNLLRLFA